MNEENERLKEMLNEVTANYSVLKMHLMQNQKAHVNHNSSEGNKDIIMNNGKGENIVPRQFMDLGLASNNGDHADETSLSSSEERRSGSVSIGNNHELSDALVLLDQNDEKKQLNGRSILVREDSPGHDQSSQPNNWGPKKLPRFNSPSKIINDQNEVNMRKARVSVRARSEAPMVQYSH